MGAFINPPPPRAPNQAPPELTEPDQRVGLACAAARTKEGETQTGPVVPSRMTSPVSVADRTVNNVGGRAIAVMARAASWMLIGQMMSLAVGPQQVSCRPNAQRKRKGGAKSESILFEGRRRKILGTLPVTKGTPTL